MLSSGFTNAPVSKFLLLGVIASSIFASITDTKYLFYIEVVPHIWPYKQAWRLLTWQLCYTSSTELLFAGMTLYHMRLIERLWGSRKFASFLLTIHPLISLLPPLLLSALLRPLSLGALNYLPAGPTPLVFALLAQYHAAIPHVYKYRIATSSPTPTARQANSSSASASATTSSTSSSSPASASDPTGLLFSDKTMTYILASQLALSQLPGSLLAATVGWGVGVAWRNYLLPERVVEWRVPAWVVGEAARDGLQGERAREGFEGLRRRLEGEGRASGVESREQVRRRGLVGGMVDQFRGMF